MNKTKLLLGLLLVLQSSLGFAQTLDMADRWVFIASSDDGTDSYFDSQTKTDSFVWMKTIVPASKYKEFKRKFTIEKIYYDCKNRTLAVGAGKYISLTGETREIEKDESIVYKEVLPDSFGEIMLNKFCSFR